MSRREREKEEVSELRLPAEGEVVGIVEGALGFDRLKVRCADGRVRLCRIPGRMKKRIWIKERDLVLVAPWEFQYDRKGDVIHRYSKGEVEELKRRGLLGELELEV